MEFRKKLFIVGAIVLSIGLFAGCGGPPMFCDRDFSNHILTRVDKHVEDLDLSATQKEKYAEIRLQIKDNLTKGAQSRKAFFTELKNEINKDNPDINLLTGLVKQRFKGGPSHLAENLELFEEFYNILDENQKALLMEDIRTKMNRFAAFMCLD
ncbi:MAG: hypothetical protein ISS59_03390 [Desulfobacteraceae bacterium]|nr:hypothetical protein [Desulfobacteraceae bacterium]